VYLGLEASRGLSENRSCIMCRRQLQVDKINKEELREIWQQITDNNFEALGEVL
jgi:hypothetical protein